MRKTVLICDRCGKQADDVQSTANNWYLVEMVVNSDDEDAEKHETIRHHLCGKCADVAVIPFRDLCELGPECAPNAPAHLPGNDAEVDNG